MESGSSAGVTLDVLFGFNDPNFSDRTLQLEIIADDDNVKRLRSDDLLNNASTSTAPPLVKTIHINSLILAARSPFFRNLFSNGMQESGQKHVTLRIEASEEVSFRDLLKFVYSNNLPTSLDALRNLLLMADKYEVDSCLTVCARALQKLPMTCESASIYLDLPPCLLLSTTVQPLIEAAKNFLVAKFKDLHGFKEEVLNLPLLGLQAVLSSDDLRVASEVVVFKTILDWVNKHHPELEERREILKTQLLHLVRFPFMTTTQLIEKVQPCSDIDPKLASEIVICALRFKAETDSYQKRCLAAKESNIESRQYVERAYIFRPVKVFELELLHPKCVVYLDLTRNELKRMYPKGVIRSQSFHLGDQEFDLFAMCFPRTLSNENCIWLGLEVLKSSTNCTVKYELSVISKPQEDFECWYRGNHTFIETRKAVMFLCEEWAGFIGNDSSYFLNDILHLRAELSIME